MSSLSRVRNAQTDLALDGYALDERISARARCVRIEVRSPQEVRLVIPRGVPLALAREFAASRRAWIRDKIAELVQRQPGAAQTGPRPLSWNGEDRLPLRGVERGLRLVPAQLRRPQVRIDEDRISLFAPPALLAMPRQLERLLRDSLRREATGDAHRLLAAEAARLGVSYEGPRMADQKSLWGSCTPAGLISLSWRLVLAPPDVFRYVVVHELCHRIELNHSQRFWALVARQMPGYAPHRRWLREQGAQLHGWLAG
jgi:predicted metal-dependent hydrolase